MPDWSIMSRQSTTDCLAAHKSWNRATAHDLPLYYIAWSLLAAAEYDWDPASE